MKLDFIILGGQKCGSTYLQEVISEHPEVKMINGECPHFESPDYEEGGIKKLEELIEKLDKAKIIGIKRPSYLSKPEVPLRIKHINEDIKLIVILRDPIERLKSAYFHSMNLGFTPILSINKGVEKLLNGNLSAKYPRTPELLEFSLYSKSLQNYLNLFKDNVLILTYDQLKENKLNIIKKCYSFLKVDSNFIPTVSLHTRPQKVNYSLLRAWLLTKKNSHQFVYNKKITRLFNKKQSGWDRFICRNIDRIDRLLIQKIVPIERPSFHPKIKNRLLDFFSSDIENLESILNIDLSFWKE